MKKCTNGANIDSLETKDNRCLMSRTCFQSSQVYLKGDFESQRSRCFLVRPRSRSLDYQFNSRINPVDREEEKMITDYGRCPIPH
jgi:hypothetical protein